MFKKIVLSEPQIGRDRGSSMRSRRRKMKRKTFRHAMYVKIGTCRVFSLFFSEFLLLFCELQTYELVSECVCVCMRLVPLFDQICRLGLKKKEMKVSSLQNPNRFTY